MKCQSCKLSKANLTKSNSILIPSIVLLMCGDCVKKKMEPRHIIILAARSGIDIREFIVKKRYHGEELTALEVTT